MRGRALSRFLRRAEGAAAIEFALIAPVVLIILAGTVNVGLRFLEQARLNQTTREVAQAAMFTSNLSVLTQLLTNALAENGIVPSSPPTVSLVCICPGQPEVRNCTTLDSASCAATGLPWALAVEVTAATLYQPLIGREPIPLASQVRIQIR